MTTCYSGDVDARGLRHGFGTYRYPAAMGSFVYEGQWSAGRKHGCGVLRIGDVSVYTGGASTDGYDVVLFC